MKKIPRAKQMMGKNETSLPKMKTLRDHSCSEKESKSGEERQAD